MGLAFVEEGLKKFEEDMAWFSERYDELRTKYEGKVLAIKDKKIVAVNDDYKVILEILKKKNLDPCQVLIDSILPEDVAFIL